MLDPSAPVTAPSTTPLNVASLVRLVLAAAGGIFVKDGYVTSDQLQTVVGAIFIIGTALWHFYKNGQMASKIATAIASPAKPVVTSAGVRVPPAVVSIALALVVGAFCAPWLSGCASPSASSSISAAQLAIHKSEFAAETAYQLAADAYSQAESLLTPIQKAEAKGFLAQAKDALDAARSRSSA